MSDPIPVQPNTTNNISRASDAARQDGSDNKPRWKSRLVQVVAVGVGILASAALLISACYLAAVIVGTVTAITVIGCSVKYLYDLPPHPGAVFAGWLKSNPVPLPESSAPKPLPESSAPKPTPAPERLPSPDPFNLQRFYKAQNDQPDFSSSKSCHQKALDEMDKGRKVSHWSWFECPVVDGFGNSDKAKLYALKSLEEVKAYYAQPILKARLLDFFSRVNQHIVAKKTASNIMGNSTDAAKLRSCATIFALVTKEPIFQTTIDNFYHGPCMTAKDTYDGWMSKK